VDDFKSVLDNAHGHQLLAVVASMSHQRVGQTLCDWAKGFTEALGLITTGSVWEIDRISDFDVILRITLARRRTLYSIFAFFTWREMSLMVTSS
jgi:hypothetical protein